jgi:lipopolysaccharide/colanic/teichoic acid biosynthesis glycosyltransferase
MKRLFDFIAALLGLIVLSPILIILSIAIWMQDWHSPFYVAPRVGKGDKPFKMVKFRSMVIRADKSGVDSTAGDDPRITSLGKFIRRFKLDELPQLWNVFLGQMSLVGPRPNVKRETDLYTREEKRLLTARPGITDLSSIVFSDEGDILMGSDDPDLKYNQVIRPGKSRLGLLYVDKMGSIGLDLQIIALTLKGAVNRDTALQGVTHVVQQLGGDTALQEIARRQKPLRAEPPPGAKQVVSNREGVAV